MTVVRLFGRPTLADGSPLALERLGQMAVVLATRAAWTTREALMSLLWPERPSEAARRNLRRLLFRARREAWLAGLEQHGDSLRWPVESDAREFDPACDRHDWAAAVRPMMANTCYSFIDDRNAVHVASVHRWVPEKKTLEAVAGSVGISSQDRPSWALEGQYALG